MKRIVLGIGFATALAGVLFASAYAQQSSELTPTHIEAIRQNCTSAQRSINRVRMNDSLARLNLGREYETLFNKLIAPMNSRIALNGLDATEFAALAASYDKQLDQFRLIHKEYDETINSAITIKCSEKPEEFYALLTKARSKRAEVVQIVDTLDKLVTDYGTSIDDLMTQTVSTETQ